MPCAFEGGFSLSCVPALTVTGACREQAKTQRVSATSSTAQRRMVKLQEGPYIESTPFHRLLAHLPRWNMEGGRVQVFASSPRARANSVAVYFLSFFAGGRATRAIGAR